MNQSNRRDIRRSTGWFAASALVVAGIAMGAGTPIEARADTPIRIGFINPVTGAFGSLGKSARQGMELALANAAADPELKEIRLVVEDQDAVGHDRCPATRRLPSAGSKVSWPSAALPPVA